MPKVAKLPNSIQAIAALLNDRVPPPHWTITPDGCAMAKIADNCELHIRLVYDSEIRGFLVVPETEEVIQVETSTSLVQAAMAVDPAMIWQQMQHADEVDAPNQ